jgi:tRNA(fMet)-specific endonuclease VapC
MTDIRLLDTNTASYIIKGQPLKVRENLRQFEMSDICISVITEAELLLGVAMKPEAKNLAGAVNEFLLRVNILPWESNAANAYAEIRVAAAKTGKNLGAMNMLIAAHSVAVGAVLVTNDKAFSHFKKYLSLENWTRKIQH